MKIILIAVLLVGFKSFASGTYEQDCRVIGEDDYVKYTLETEGFNKGASWTLKLTAFEDENCATPYLQYNQYFHLTKIEGENVEFETEKITYAPLSFETTDALNLMQYCGAADWMPETEMDVTGRSCGDFQQLSQKQKLFQILRLSENHLSLGLITSSHSGRAEQQRPVDFDLTFTQRP